MEMLTANKENGSHEEQAENPNPSKKMVPAREAGNYRAGEGLRNSSDALRTLDQIREQVPQWKQSPNCAETSKF